MRFFRERFDPRREFVLVRNLKVNTQRYTTGTPVDRSWFTDRRLRQLYDQRVIGYAVTTSVVPRPPRVATTPPVLADHRMEVVGEELKPKVARFRPTPGKVPRLRPSAKGSETQPPTP